MSIKVTTVTRDIVHGPVARSGVGFGLREPMLEIEEPFFELGRGAVGEAAGEAGEPDRDLTRVDHHPADRRAEDDLAREGVEGHLVVWLVLVEVVIRNRRLGRLVVHDVRSAGEGDDAVEVAA